MCRIACLLLIVCLLAGAADKRSGYHDASPETRAMQDDDAANPGFLWVQQGATLWLRAPGPGILACAGCHTADAMKGVAARYPRFDADRGHPVPLDGRIRQCRTRHQGQPDLGPDSETILALTAWVGLQSRGQPMRIDTGEAAQSALTRGRTLFHTRMGQLNLSCAQCHDALAGQRLAGSAIPQGHANAYPQYRLEWQSMGSLERRIRNCLNGIRAEPFDTDDPDLLALMFYLGWRANGLPVEIPAVRP